MGCCAAVFALSRAIERESEGDPSDPRRIGQIPLPERAAGCRHQLPTSSSLRYYLRLTSSPKHSADSAQTLLVAASEVAAGQAFTVVVVDGSDSGKSFAVDGTQPRVLIGTSSACGIRLNDPAVSRRHAALDVQGSRLRVTDVGSSNGTLVGNVRVLDAFVEVGESIRVGFTTLRVVARDEPSNLVLSTLSSFGGVVGASVAMRRLYPLCERLADSEVSVIIEGETGTGKEVLAESIHQQGARSGGPFVVFDCTAVPSNLIESALFGHEKGSFTGAVSTRAGVFEQAHRGTLLIDEIGELDISLQPKLLRVIQRMEVQRIGAQHPIKVDVRVIAATRRDLDREVQAGRFRDDLFFRLNVARIELPPLRRRAGDVELLARHFSAMLGAPADALSTRLMRAFCDYDWPGNVRELQNAVSRHLALGELAGFGAGAFERSAQPSSIGGASPSGDFLEDVVAMHLPLQYARQQVIEEFERRYVNNAIERHGGSTSHAATEAGVATRYFRLLRARYNR